MSVAKVIEINAESPNSFEEAVRIGIDRALKTLTGVQGAWIKEQKVVIEEGRIKGYRVDMKVTFLLED